ncbi:tubulin polyglutamylase TTLL4-like protein [Leptotrombidium deliense]|uniref:Tubulin polyglutamylase TTLL4-like protein n=1 Tax=Leptotrombidium deliense TaxID=299467 RepID=A0A443SK09_9ACAR|nr:tubulin polyglutamylase TTLL4-like protein [Leptotrombidium deliense]
MLRKRKDTQKETLNEGHRRFASNSTQASIIGSATRSTTNYISIALLAVVLVLTVCNFISLKRLENYDFFKNRKSEDTNKQVADRPRVWIRGQRMEAGYLKHVIDVFQRIGFQTVNGSFQEWDILWSHEYPFTKGYFKTLKPHQKVNHFPGSGYITNKVSLATSDLKHIPVAFLLPKSKDKLLKFVEENPDHLWVKKSNDHRGIRIENLTVSDLDSPGTFVQQYIHNPFLIDGKKFDIGIYVTLTSVKPLRVYIYENDVLLRFCFKEYHPFDENNIDSYVVADDYTPIWEMPSLRKYYVDLNLNMKQSLNAYLRSMDVDPEQIWTQIEESIASVYVAKETMMSQLSTAFNSSRHFFEMVRFDFLLDEHLNVYLMEANMSPNLSSAHFAENKLLYEQVIFNLLSLIGATRSLDIHSWTNYPSKAWDMRVSDKDLSVYEDICSSTECHLSCKSSNCQVCFYCLKDDFKLHLKDAYLEHNSKWGTKRLIPSTNESFIKPMDSVNELNRLWFIGKCIQDESWC